MEKVAVVKCESYDQNKVEKAVDDIFEYLGGIEKFIKPKMKVLIKPNLVMKKKPEEAVTTHPCVVEAIAKKVLALGAEVIIADSPGGFYNEKYLKFVYTGCGYKELADRNNVKLNYDTSTIERACEKGKVAKKFTFIKPVDDVDFIINVPKLKTHGMMVFTGAVKNLFGLIPGALKAEYHLRMNNNKDFSDLLVDICECIKPQISIMDAIDAMEGAGPTAGSPRHLGLMIASINPYALDVVATSVIGLNNTQVYTIVRASERGLISSLEQVELLGENIKTCSVNDFELPHMFRDITFFKNRTFKFMANYLKPKPVFLHEQCIGCEECVNHCPPRAIEFKAGKPIVDLGKCIRCFCCQELCPKKAVEIKKPWITRKIIKDS